jgi:hypothetical protein
MGNAGARITNDTNDSVMIYVFNYADAIRSVPRSEHILQAGESIDVEAAAHDSGLIVATGKEKQGKHMAVRNNTELKISILLKHGDDNPSHGQAMTGIGYALNAAAILK